ncbi:MAG TPA: methyltransferase [Steroidobacteraceae bacterium]|jgi:HemK-related putative methylase
MGAQLQALQPLLDAPAYGAIRRVIGKLMHWRYRLLQQKRHRDFVLEQVAGLPLLVAPGVLNPRLMRTGEFFASQLRADLLPPGVQVLDMGTGSGVCALVAARHSRDVVAVDINPDAIRCARINAMINQCEDRIEILPGDLFAPLAGRRFDVVLFNPPFLRGVPRDDADRAWRSTDIAERFASELRAHLTPSGFALVLLSNYGGAAEFVSQFRRHEFCITVVAERRFVNERLAILKLS